MKKQTTVKRVIGLIMAIALCFCFAVPVFALAQTYVLISVETGEFASITNFVKEEVYEWEEGGWDYIMKVVYATAPATITVLQDAERVSPDGSYVGGLPGGTVKRATLPDDMDFNGFDYGGEEEIPLSTGQYLQGDTDSGGTWYVVPTGSAFVLNEGTYYLPSVVGDEFIIVVTGDGTPPATPATPTTDQPSSWATDQVNAAIAENLVPQYLQSKYTQATTRAEFCALAVALYENVKGEITGRSAFTDTNDINVQKAASIGVVTGVGDNRFDPDARLTREQAAVMLSRLMDLFIEQRPLAPATFSDVGQVSSWAIRGVSHMQDTGIMGGVGDNRFAPKDPYTREQSIITILRLFDVVK